MAINVSAVLRSESNGILDLAAQRWVDDADAIDEQLLAQAVGPVLDVGCGPGRHVAALHRRGVEVLGIDVSDHAVSHACDRQLPVVQCSVFESLPLAGEWATVLLLDGNVGIGGDPVTLISRVASLLSVDGRIFIELAPLDNQPAVDSVRLELDGVAGPWFPWAHVDAVGLARVAKACDMLVDDEWHIDSRHFVILSNRREGVV